MEFELIELSDWTCCGATAAHGISELLALALPARNLALAEKQMPGLDLLVPCSACYLNLKQVEDKVQNSPQTVKTINRILRSENLSLKGRQKVRHLLDVLVNDMDLNQFIDKVKKPLKDLTVAPYYGCQCLRPFALFDDPESPTSMEPLIKATGAKIHPWTMGPKCCGASHMNTKMEVGLELSGAILSAADGADAITTVCPMCQMNLEAYQKKISKLRGRDLSISILYLPQLLGLSLDIAPDILGLNLNLALADEFKTNTLMDAATLT
jgi:heterodisulfide reductase subunit B